MALNYVFVIVHEANLSTWSLQTPSMGRVEVTTETVTITEETFDDAVLDLIAQFPDVKIVSIQLKEIQIPS
jgi:hypothetical protein